jgi:hypothetical protein
MLRRLVETEDGIESRKWMLELGECCEEMMMDNISIVEEANFLYTAIITMFNSQPEFYHDSVSLHSITSQCSLRLRGYSEIGCAKHPHGPVRRV